jgi:hypothetical protein
MMKPILTDRNKIRMMMMVVAAMTACWKTAMTTTTTTMTEKSPNLKHVQHLT